LNFLPLVRIERITAKADGNEHQAVTASRASGRHSCHLARKETAYLQALESGVHLEIVITREFDAPI
jgi:hypothetical protein